ncbi:MAG: four helix bundle protein [Verrucomicrobiales bacterium]|nr:four helix bundle protein [Verrucomicrobiales bacterium]|tara:strand:+ start:1177 stop:1917 length:741 start_codon:yes stop_codon:yes gene_type:complete
MKDALKRLQWIAKLTPETCPGGAPKNDREWRNLVNRIVKEVRQVLKESDKSGRSDESDLIPKHGGYRRPRSSQVAEIVHGATQIFCDRFITKRSRTHDQMVQAARSGRQNIAEGSMASGTSKKTELKLTNVAKASLEELLLDYQDFLRQTCLRHWHNDDSKALEVRKRYRSYPKAWLEEREETMERLDPYDIQKASATTAANTLICLINQATYLLKRQLNVQANTFTEEGGFTERLYKTRKVSRAL